MNYFKNISKTFSIWILYAILIFVAVGLIKQWFSFYGIFGQLDWDTKSIIQSENYFIIRFFLWAGISSTLIIVPLQSKG